MVIDSLVGKFTGSARDCVITDLEVPSKSFNSIRGTEVTGRFCLCTREGSTKQWVEPESISADIIRAESEIAEDVKETWSELGSERADAFSRTTSEVAQGGSTQSSACAEARGLLSLFLTWEKFLSP